LPKLASRLAREEDSEFAATRYVPALKSILEALCNDELSMEEYPSVTPMPAQSAAPAGRTSARTSRKASGAAASARKATGPSSKWSSNTGSTLGTRSVGPVNYTGARYLVFMMGGLCYSEMRAAREVMESESREIILGSTAFLSAGEFMEELGRLGDQI
jgi:syntaxin-binding protein 1